MFNFDYAIRVFDDAVIPKVADLLKGIEHAFRPNSRRTPGSPHVASFYVDGCFVEDVSHALAGAAVENKIEPIN